MIWNQRCKRFVALAFRGRWMVGLFFGALLLSPVQVDADDVIEGIGTAITQAGEALKALQRLCDTIAMPGGVVGANTPGVGGAVDIAYLEGLKGAVSQQLGAARAGADSAVENARTTLTKLEQAKANGVSSEALANATEAVRIIARDAENERRGVQSKKQTIDAQRQPLDREINRLLNELKEKTKELIGEKNKSWMRRDDAKIAQITGEMSQLQAAIQSKKTEKTPLDEDFDVQEQLLTTIMRRNGRRPPPIWRQSPKPIKMAPTTRSSSRRPQSSSRRPKRREPSLTRPGLRSKRPQRRCKGACKVKLTS